jgi:hypothetical protein
MNLKNQNNLQFVTDGAVHRLISCMVNHREKGTIYIWARLVQLRERLHEQLHNFNSQTTGQLL